MNNLTTKVLGVGCGRGVTSGVLCLTLRATSNEGVEKEGERFV